jgi:hypothetical protein
MQQKYLLIVISIHQSTSASLCPQATQQRRKNSFFLVDTKQYYFTFHSIRSKKDISFTSMVSIESDFTVFTNIQDAKFPLLLIASMLLIIRSEINF